MNDVNLIPAKRLANKHRMARLHVWAVICGIYLAVLVVASLSAYAVWRSSDNGMTEELKSSEERIQRWNASMVELRGELTRARTALRMSRAISGQLDWSKLLILLSNQLGDEVVLNNCQLAALNKDGQDSTSHLPKPFSSSAADMCLAEQRYRLKLSGLGRTQGSVSQFVLRLERIGVFDSVRLVNSYRQSFLSGQAVAFSVECSI